MILREENHANTKTRFIRSGRHGAATELKDLGFDPNGVDGNFGPGTRDAVIAFQQSKGLFVV